jgi:hypothetical protein
MKTLRPLDGFRRCHLMRRTIRSLPGPAWVLVAGAAINRFGSFVALLLVLYLVDRG